MINKSRIIFAIIGLIIFSFCMEGWGANWKFIGKDNEGSVWEIDLTSISRQPNNIVRVWGKIQGFFSFHGLKGISLHREKSPYVKSGSLFFGWWGNIFR